MKDLAASVRYRLSELSRQTGEEFNRLLLRYVVERLLYRLSRSSHRERFILKGAVLFTVWQEGKPTYRATRDLDLAGLQVGQVAELAELFRSIMALPVEDDGVRFDSSVKSEPIMPRADVEMGVRLNLTARLGQARIPLQVDVGFGDEIHPAPQEVVFPTILAFPQPHLWAYQRETVVAEKLQAWLERGVQSSRLKDLFDLLYLAENFSFQASPLMESLERTLDRRGHQLGELPPYVLTEALGQDPIKQTQWKAFLRRSHLPDHDLAETVSVISGFLLPLLQAMQAGTTSKLHWAPRGPWTPPDSSTINESEDR